MLEGVGLGLAGPSFHTAYFSPGQSAVAARPDPAKPSRSASLEWVKSSLG